MKTHLRIAATALATLALGANGFAQTLTDAIRLSDNEQFERAKHTLRQLLMKEPTNGDLYFYMGDVYMKQEEQDSAGIYFMKGAAMNPTNPLALVGKGRYLIYTNKAEDGKREFSQANALITAQKDLPKARVVASYLEMAETYTYAPQPDFDQAILLTQRAQKLDDKNAEVFLVRGDVYRMQDRVNGSPAIESYKQAAALDPKSCKASLRIGSLYYGGQNYDGALEFFDKATNTDSTFAPAWRAKAETFFQQGKFPQGAECYRKYLLLNDDPYARYRYVANLYLSKQHQDVVTETERVWQKDTTILVLYRLISNSQFELAAYEPALLNMNKFITRATEKGSPKVTSSDYEGRARILQKLTKDSLALIDFEKAYSMDTSRKELFGDIGNSYLKQKKYDVAATWFRKKNEVSGYRSINDLNSYGRALFLSKNYVTADSIYQLMNTIDPKLATTYYWRGRCYSAQTADETIKNKAKPYYEQFISMASADKVKNKKDLIVACKWMGGYHLTAKNYACAKAYYLLIKELDPENADAKTALESKELVNVTAVELTTCFQQPMLYVAPVEAPQGSPNGQ